MFHERVLSKGVAFPTSLRPINGIPLSNIGEVIARLIDLHPQEDKPLSITRSVLVHAYDSVRKS